jgi:hypothetical protein
VVQIYIPRRGEQGGGGARGKINKKIWREIKACENKQGQSNYGNRSNKSLANFQKN